MTWKEVIIEALNNLNGVATYKQLYDEISFARNKILLENWKASVRGTIERFSSDSKVFEGKEDVFYSALGVGKGIWGLRDFSNVKKPCEPLAELDTKRKDITVNRIIRDNKIIKELKALHNNECQLCGMCLRINDRFRYSEGHHIQPLGGKHKGPDIRANILILCPNCHTLCDYGAIKLDKNKIKKHSLSEIDDKFIDYHNKKLFKKN